MLNMHSAPEFLLRHDKLLGVGQTDRITIVSPAFSWLMKGGDQIGRCRDDHFVEGGVLGPAGVAVPDADCDIGNPCRLSR
jgi:hypothetical protein